MKQVQKLWADLSAKASTELSEEKVELGAIDDLKTDIQKILRLRDGSYAINKEALTLKGNIKPLLKEIEVNKKYAKDNLSAAEGNKKLIDSAESKLKSSFSKVEKQADELGISVSGLPVYKEYRAALNGLKESKEFVIDGASISEELLSKLI